MNYTCGFCGEPSSYQGHTMKDKEGWFFECDPKNAVRAEQAVQRLIYIMNNRHELKFSAYNGKTKSYVTKAKRHGR